MLMVATVNVNTPTTIIGTLIDTLDDVDLDAIFVTSALPLSADHEVTLRAMNAKTLAPVGRKFPMPVPSQ